MIMKTRTIAIIGVMSALCIAIIIAVVFTQVVDAAPATNGQGMDEKNQEPKKAVVLFNIKSKDSENVEGSLELVQASPTSPVVITGTLKGLTAGKHGFHVHESGNVGDGCKSTRGHFNPKKSDHGAPTDPTSARHIGDLGNIEATANGEATINIEDPIISLFGDESIFGRAFVVHADVDDLGKGGHKDSKTTGNAGGRLACGIIGVA